MRVRKWLILMLTVLLVFTTGCTLFGGGSDDGKTPGKKKITLTAYDSSEEIDLDNDVAANVLDGDSETMWHTKWWDTDVTENPESITIVLSELAYVHKFRYLPRQDEEWNGTITKYEIQYSVDGETFETIVEGEWEKDKEWKEVKFDPVKALEIRLVVHDGHGGHASAAEIELGITPIEVNEEE